MKTIIIAIMLLALAIWGGKTMYEASSGKGDQMNVAVAPSVDTKELMGMLPSGETAPADIAPAAGE